MRHTALAQTLDEDQIDTVDAIAAPLRALSPHIAEMTHAQELSDVTILCECLWAVAQGGEQAAGGRAVFREYLERRRKVGFSTEELQAIVEAMGRVVSRRLELTSANGDVTPADLEEARTQLATALGALQRAIMDSSDAAPA